MNKVCFSVACAAALFGFTSFAEGETVVTNEMTLANKTVVSTNIEIAANTVLKVSVASGTATISGLISGGGKICKVGTGTLLLGKYNSATEILPSKDGNTFTGGVDVQEGVLASDQVIKNAWGSGKVTVNCKNGARLLLRGTLPNDIESFDDSTKDCPLLQVGAQTFYNGNIVAHGDVYFSDINYASSPTRKDSETFQVGGTVTILGEGKGFYAAPCTRINFKNTVTADLVKGYWISMKEADASYDSSPTHGNLGSIKFSMPSNVIKKLEIEQTRIICGTNNCFVNTIIEFMGEHMAEGVGYFDLAGFNNYTPGVGAIIAPTPTSLDCPGAVITNSSSSSALRSITILGKQSNDVVNARFDGAISVTLNCGGPVTLAARRHSMSGALNLNNDITWSEDVTFPNLTGVSSANGSNQDFASLPAGFFSKVTSVSISSSNVKLKPDLFTPGKVALALNSTSKV